MLYHASNEPDILQEAEKRQNRILDADYHKVEVDPYVQELTHLTKEEKQVLGETLKKVPNIVWRWTWNVKYQTCKVRIDLWCKTLPCKTIP
jgi:hypothetical protein